MKAIFTGLFLFVATAAGFSQTVFDKAKADSLFDGLEKYNKAMGSVMVRQNGALVYARSIGFRSDEGGNKLPNTDQTKFRIGSISKMFTSVLIFQQIEEGKLTLETKLSEYFPQLPNASLITVDLLLTHGSGLSNFTNDKSYAKIETKPQSHEQLLALFAKAKPDFVPGTKHEYSNTNFVLLGYILEKVTGKPYAELLTTKILQPLGLTSSSYGSTIAPGREEAFSYAFEKGTWTKQTETDMSIPHGAGSVVSSPTDLAVFLEGLFNGKLLKKETLDKMTTLVGGYGHGIFKYPFKTRVAYGHGGAIDGFRSEASYFPDEKLALTVCFNGLNYSQNTILTGILSIYFNEPYTLPDFNAVKLTDAQLARYEGTFSAPGFPLKITLKKSDGELTAQATGQSAFTLDAANETDFSFMHAGIRMKMALNGNKPITGFHFSQGGTELDFKRVK